MGKKMSVSKIVEINEDINTIFEELQKKMGYDTQIDNHKQLLKMLLKLLDTEIINYIKTENEKHFRNAIKIINLIESITTSCTFSEKDTHLFIFKQARLLIKITGLTAETLNNTIKTNLTHLKDKISNILFRNKDETKQSFYPQIGNLERILESQRILIIFNDNNEQQKDIRNKENQKLFIYILKKCFEHIEAQNDSIYQYLHILHILASQISDLKIDLSFFKRLETLKVRNLPPKFSIIINELENIMQNKTHNITPTEVMVKYDIKPKLTEESASQAKDFQLLIYKEANPVTITIDGTVRDSIKDDAISIRQERDGYTLGIHIADVGSFLKPKSQLDLNAQQTFKSIYLPNQIIHMIPPNISKQHLSLDKGKKRNAISLYVKLGKTGEIEDYYFTEETISIDHSLSYTSADRILQGEISISSDLDYSIKLLEYITSLLNNSQRNDYRFIKDIIHDISIVDRHYSEKIVHESMILYNRLLAEYLSKIGELPVIYRIHEKPEIPTLESLLKSPEKLDQDTITILGEFYPKAAYSLNNVGHFGLKLNTYSHSSAPIRRYTDIFMQRLYFLSKQDITASQLRQLEKEALDLVEYANKREKELRMFEEEYEEAYIKTLKPCDK